MPKNLHKEGRKQRWLVLQDSGWKIVIPETDSKAHENSQDKKKKIAIAGLTCPCKPKIYWVDKILVHNSFMDMEKINDSIVNLYENPAEMNLI
jgi:hypothetical protein